VTENKPATAEGPKEGCSELHFHVEPTDNCCDKRPQESEPSSIVARITEVHVPYLKPVLAGLLASAIIYLCFLTWLHWKVVSLVQEQGASELMGVTGAQVYVVHSPSFWALAIIAFGVVFFLFRNP
jgi:hypothetical protein